MSGVRKPAAAPAFGARLPRRRPDFGFVAAQALLGASLALAVGACERRAERAPNVLVVVVDTLRADRLGVHGNRRGLTPFLDEWAARAVVFTNAYAASSWTCPSVASLLTSRYPSQHHVVSFASRLGAAERTLAETLAPLRYVAGGFSANFRLLDSLGYGQGFDHWQAELKTGGDLSAGELNQQALRWLDAAWSRDSERPALLYLQYMDPHAPYDPPEPFRGRFGAAAGDAVAANEKLLATRWFDLTGADVDLLASLYDAEVASVDEQLRRLFAELTRRGFLDHAVVVVTADHGEEFWEHGNLTHGIALYEESVRVPLIVAPPGLAGGRRVDTPVSLLDVAPTLLDVLGLPPEPHFEGRSLVDLWKDPVAGETAAKDVVLQLESTGDGVDAREHAAAIRHGFAKLLSRPNGFTESYDLSADPGEEEPAPVGPADERPALLRRLETVRAALRERAGAAPERAPLDDATREKLRALGYQF